AFTRDRRLCECRERASANAVVPVLLGRLRHLRHLVRDRGEVAELPRGPRGVVAALERRLELDGAKEELARGLARLAAEGPLPGDLEHVRRRPRELERRAAVELLEQVRRLVEVVRADLEQLLVGTLAQPLRKVLVVLRTRRLRQRGVRNLADEDVLEAVRDLAREAGVQLAREEIAHEQVVERVLEVVAEVRRKRGERAVREDATEHRRPLQQDLRAA